MQAAEVEREARAAFARGDETEACRRLEALLAEQPGCYAQRCLLGFIHQQAGRLVQARTAYEAARAIAPPSRELEQNLGQVYLRLGEAPLALAAFEAALQLAPEALDLLDAVAAARQAACDLPGALVCYERILRRDPQHVPAFVGMAEAFADRGWNDDARRSLETALSIEPGHPPALNLMGVLVIKIKSGVDYMLAAIAVSLLVKIFLMAVFSRAVGVNPFLITPESATELLGSMSHVLTRGGVAVSQQTIKEYAEAMVSTVTLMMPSMLILFAAIDSITAYALTRLYFKRAGGFKLPSLPPFGYWRFPKNIFWALLAALVLDMASKAFPDEYLYKMLSVNLMDGAGSLGFALGSTGFGWADPGGGCGPWATCGADLPLFPACCAAFPG